MLSMQLYMLGMVIVLTIGAAALYAWDESIELINKLIKKIGLIVYISKMIIELKKA